MRTVYLCAAKSHQETYKRLAKEIYEGEVVFTENIQEAEMIFSMQPVTEQQTSILQEAESLKKPIIRMTERFIPIDVYTAVLDNALDFKGATSEN